MLPLGLAIILTSVHLDNPTSNRSRFGMFSFQNESFFIKLRMHSDWLIAVAIDELTKEENKFYPVSGTTMMQM